MPTSQTRIRAVGRLTYDDVLHDLTRRALAATRAMRAVLGAVAALPPEARYSAAAGIRATDPDLLGWLTDELVAVVARDA